MKKIILGIIIVTISTGALFLESKPDGLLHVYFLDVGQGDSILIRTPGGENILVDGGPKNYVLEELKDVLPFFDSSIDYMLLTHPDSDHLDGLIPVLQRYEIGHILFPGAHKDSYLARKFLQLITEKEIPVIIADENADIEFEDGVVLNTLFPIEQMIGSQTEDVNDTSLVTRLLYGKTEVLLTGDAGIAVEAALINHGASSGASLRADILKLGHHGSSTSTSQEFFDAVAPKYAVISAGKDNSYGHPHPETMERLENAGTTIARTDQDGRIEFVFSLDKIAAIKTETGREVPILPLD